VRNWGHVPVQRATPAPTVKLPDGSNEGTQVSDSRPQKGRKAFSLYYFATLAAGIGCLAYLALAHRPERVEWMGWAFYFLVILITDTKMSESQVRGGGRILSSRTLTLSMLVLFGPLVAVIMDAGSTLVRGLVFRSAPPRKMIFNMAMLTVAATVAGLIYHALPFSNHFGTPLFLLPLMVTLLVYSFANSAIVSGIMSLDRKIPLREVWHRDARWGAVAGLMELPFTAIVILLYRQAGPWTLMIFLPIIWVVFAITRAHKQQKEAHMASIAVLATTLEADEPYTHGHSYRVSQYAITIARAIGMNPADLELLEYGGLLHDVGKIAVTNDIICKPGRLTDEEFSILAEHPAIGARIVEQIKFLPETVDLVRHHHERPDGKGYPDGLKGSEISLGANILNVCDAFDAMTSDRSYRQALPVDKALAELLKYRGSQFDASIVDTVMDLHSRGEFDVIPDSAVEKVIRQIQQVANTPPEIKTKTETVTETEVHEIRG